MILLPMIPCGASLEICTNWKKYTPIINKEINRIEFLPRKSKWNQIKDLETHESPTKNELIMYLKNHHLLHIFLKIILDRCFLDWWILQVH